MSVPDPPPVWLDWWDGPDDCIRVGLGPFDGSDAPGWYAVTGRDLPMMLDGGYGPMPTWAADLLGATAARNLAEAYRP